MPANPDEDPQVTPTPPPAPAARELEPDELSDDDLDKVSGGFFNDQVAARRIPTGSNPLL